MKSLWQIFLLWVFWVLILWLMVPCLDLKPESARQEKLMNVAPWWCSCPWFKFRKCGCPPGTLNCSLCHHTVRGNWFDACYEKTMGYLTGATESTSPDAVLWGSGRNSAHELGKVWKKLSKVIPRLSVSHFDLFCGTCALVRNSKILRAASPGNNVNQHTMISRLNQVPPEGFKTLKNQTTGHSTSCRSDRAQGSWRQLALLLLKLFDLAWTSDALNFGRWSSSLVELKIEKTRFQIWKTKVQGKPGHHIWDNLSIKNSNCHDSQ
ncbi:uncharacterized protein C20orf173 homolog isoform X2 [Vicugna pacos]|uniref:beta-D-galactosyl-(1->3)-N-acetyl-beta-D-galactosaminide alpha-2,3-sialyltransferase n=1 Tax=Vicugna pacos TaxID=30538 RepID=A0ABM5BV18_VICPA